MIKKLISFLFIILIALPIGFSAVEVFSQYNTDIKILSNNTMIVKKEISIQNIHEVGIVPGQVEFKIYNSDQNFELIDYKATNRYGENISSEIRKTRDFDIIMLNIFTPLLPGFEYKINLEYTLKFDPEGILFKKLQIPFAEETQIPIRNGILNLEIPQGYHLTYVNFKDNNTVFEENSVSWEIDTYSPNTIQFEYSKVPVKVGNFKGSYLFWILVNILLFILLIREIRKESRGFKQKE